MYCILALTSFIFRNTLALYVTGADAVARLPERTDISA